MLNTTIKDWQVVCGLRCRWGFRAADGTEVWRQRGIALAVLRKDTTVFLLRVPYTLRTYPGVVWS
jgi:hypothetical protein